MGRVIVSAALSVDGYLEGRGGDLSVMPLDESFNIHNLHRIREASRVLYGATTYRQMVGYWPNALGDPAVSDAEHEIAQRMSDGLPVIVVSDTLHPDDTGPWRDQTTIVRRRDAHAAVAALREEPGDTLVFGSRTVWSGLLADGLVDELYLMIGPRIVSGDAPAFSDVPPTGLRLLEVQRFDGSEAVVLHYEVLHEAVG